MNAVSLVRGALREKMNERRLCAEPEEEFRRVKGSDMGAGMVASLCVYGCGNV